jgi:hypothetical protein
VISTSNSGLINYKNTNNINSDNKSHSVVGINEKNGLNFMRGVGLVTQTNDS